ncbi:hypothetical protein IAR55_001374 [Kwoniella newhampshirensis]|uniref:SMP domain-containing protein n=1 Tax=Kwoniella newhampshirensis TaxID=1651941 RepID=A0AAW0Z1Z4_9TREE
MAGIRTMMSAAREEAAIISTELATAARTAAVEGGVAAERQAVMDVMNPVAVRQAAENSVKEAVGETSLLAEHLSHIRPPTTTLQTTTTTATTTSLTATAGSTITSSTRTIVTQALEEDLGVTLKEVMSNATQTGLEEQMDQIVDVAKTLAAGNGPNLSMLAQRA